MQSPTSGLLDGDNQVVRDAIQEAAQNKRDDLLAIAMHNHNVNVQIFCMENFGYLDRNTQAKLLAKILVDRSIFRYKGETHTGDLTLQARLQYAAKALASRLLQQPPPPQGLITAAEAQALATQLQAIQ